MDGAFPSVGVASLVAGASNRRRSAVFAPRVREAVLFSEVKAHLSEIADRVERQHDRILVTRNGRPSFVFLSPDDLDSLEETLAILRDDELMESLRRSRREAVEGRRSSLGEHRWGFRGV